MKKYSSTEVSKFDNNTYLGRMMHFSKITDIRYINNISQGLTIAISCSKIPKKEYLSK